MSTFHEAVEQLEAIARAKREAEKRIDELVSLSLRERVGVRVYQEPSPRRLYAIQPTQEAP